MMTAAARHTAQRRHDQTCLVDEGDVAGIRRAADVDEVLPWRQEHLADRLRVVGGVHVGEVRPVRQLLEVRGIVAEEQRESLLIAELLQRLAEGAVRQESQHCQAAECRGGACSQQACSRTAILVTECGPATCWRLRVLPVYGTLEPSVAESKRRI